MMGLPHLQFRHPIKNFARIEIAKNAALEFKQKRRMNRVTEIEQRVRSCESIAQLTTTHSHAAHLPEIVCIGGGRLMQEAITKAVFAKTALKTFYARAIGTRIACRREQFEPDGIEFQPLQPEHPLQRNRKNAATMAIFRGETAAEKNGHGG